MMQADHNNLRNILRNSCINPVFYALSNLGLLDINGNRNTLINISMVFYKLFYPLDNQIDLIINLNTNIQTFLKENFIIRRNNELVFNLVGLEEDQLAQDIGNVNTEITALRDHFTNNQPNINNKNNNIPNIQDNTFMHIRDLITGNNGIWHHVGNTEINITDFLRFGDYKALMLAGLMILYTITRNLYNNNNRDMINLKNQIIISLDKKLTVTDEDINKLQNFFIYLVNNGLKSYIKYILTYLNIFIYVFCRGTQSFIESYRNIHNNNIEIISRVRNGIIIPITKCITDRLMEEINGINNIEDLSNQFNGICNSIHNKCINKINPNIINPDNIENFTNFMNNFRKKCVCKKIKRDYNKKNP